MKDKHPSPSKLTAEELQLIQRLREHPELMGRFRSILEISTSGAGPLIRADEVEELLIQEMRRVGKLTMESWASGVEESLGQRLQQKDASAVVRKKNAEVVVRIRGGQCKRTGLAYGAKPILTSLTQGH